MTGREQTAILTDLFKKRSSAIKRMKREDDE